MFHFIYLRFHRKTKRRHGTPSFISNLVAVFDPVFSPVNGTFLCAANAIFDLFVTESLIAMSLGKCTVLTDEEEMMLPWKAARLIRDHNIKMLEFTPSRAMLFLNNKEFF